MDTLIVTTGEQHPTDLADLRGRRLAIATETDEGRRLAEAKVKALAGGDRIRARHMRRDFFEFAPSHKLVIVGNHRPALRNVDEAMRRRLLLIPFEVVIPEAERDPDLVDKLLAERPAILQWMITGCLAWQRQGLDPPACVRVATEDYLETADAVGRWLDERCRYGPNETMTKAGAFASWKAWAEAAGEFVGTARRLSERLGRIPGVDEIRLGEGPHPGLARRRAAPRGDAVTTVTDRTDTSPRYRRSRARARNGDNAGFCPLRPSARPRGFRGAAPRLLAHRPGSRRMRPPSSPPWLWSTPRAA